MTPPRQSTLTDVPLLDAVTPALDALLRGDGYVGIVLVDLEPLGLIEAEFGSDAYNDVIAAIAGELTALRKAVIRSDDILCRVAPEGEGFVLFLGAPRTSSPLNSTALEGVTDRIWSALTPRVAEIVRPYDTRGRVRLGYALVLRNPMIKTERLVYRGIRQARMVAEDFSRRVDSRSRERLRDLIVARQLRSAFQPIFQMGERRVRAYEALIRGPVGTDLASPAMLFSMAEFADLVPELDRACCETALANATDIPEGTLLFANVLPALLNDSGFRDLMTDPARCPLDPSRVVLELNEGTAVRSYEVLVKAIDEMRDKGIRLAVDDLGAGHSNLEHVLRLRPDFLKIDISLVRGVHESAVKRTMIESVVAMGLAVNATVIAEGIEEPAELEVLTQLGVSWGQGFLLARPAHEFLPADPAPVPAPPPPGTPKA